MAGSAGTLSPLACSLRLRQATLGARDVLTVFSGNGVGGSDRFHRCMGQENAASQSLWSSLSLQQRQSAQKSLNVLPRIASMAAWWRQRRPSTYMV